MAVRFHKADIAFRAPKSMLLKTFLPAQFFQSTQKKLNLDCVFCSDEYLLHVNRNFLQHDYYTDIITFPLEETERLVTAEIYISIDRVRENAALNKVAFDNEFQRVLFHGVLHLCGYGDKTNREAKRMRSMEDQWIRDFSAFIG